MPGGRGDDHGAFNRHGITIFRHETLFVMGMVVEEAAATVEADRPEDPAVALAEVLVVEVEEVEAVVVPQEVGKQRIPNFFQKR